MRASSTVFWAFCLLLACSFSRCRRCEAIRCYICQGMNSTISGSILAETNATDHPNCADDPFDENAGVPLITCNATVHNTCYKNLVHFYELDPAANQRSLAYTVVTRLCGYRDPERRQNRCKEHEGLDTITRECHCNRDGCNSAFSARPAMLTIFPLVAALNYFL